MFKKVIAMTIVMMMVMTTMTFAENADNITTDSKAWYEVICDGVVNTATSITDGCVYAAESTWGVICDGANIVVGSTGLLMMKVGKGLNETGWNLCMDTAIYFENEKKES